MDECSFQSNTRWRVFSFFFAAVSFFSPIHFYIEYKPWWELKRARAEALERLNAAGASIVYDSVTGCPTELERFLGVNWTSVRIVNFGFAMNIAIDDLRCAHSLPELREFIIGDVNAGDDAMEVISDLPNLQLVDTRGCTKITNAGVKKLGKLRKLKTALFAESRAITDQGIKELLVHTELTDLELDDTSITDAGVRDIAKLKKLEWLSLDYTSVTDKCLVDIGKLVHLESLGLSATRITDRGLKDSRAASELNKIQRGEHKHQWRRRRSVPAARTPQASALMGHEGDSGE